MSKVSAYITASSLTGTETVYVVQSGNSRKATVANLFPTSLTTQTLNATTAVVTPLLDSGTVSPIQIRVNGVTVLEMTTVTLRPVVNGGVNLGDSTKIWASVYTPLVDSGTTGSLSLRTNNGTTQLVVNHRASAVNTLQYYAGATGGSINLLSGGETNVSLLYGTKGTGGHSFQTGATDDAGSSMGSQFQILHTASASRNITITGSNGGNPTISTTAGSLAITPAVVLASTIKPAASGYLSSDGTVGLTQASTATVGRSITLKDGLVVAFA